jgi:hypothetical protein
MYLLPKNQFVSISIKEMTRIDIAIGAPIDFNTNIFVFIDSSDENSFEITLFNKFSL